MIAPCRKAGAQSLPASVKKPGESAEQVENAGMYIGWLERFLVVTAILVQSPSMVGLILTGKSIARFPELKERFAEYFLIGTGNFAQRTTPATSFCIREPLYAVRRQIVQRVEFGAHCRRY